MEQETNVAFVFADEHEAGEMYKKIQARGKYCSSPLSPLHCPCSPPNADCVTPSPPSPSLAAHLLHCPSDKKGKSEKAPATAAASSSSSKKKKGGKIDKSLISGPVCYSFPSSLSVSLG